MQFPSLCNHVANTTCVHTILRCTHACELASHGHRSSAEGSAAGHIIVALSSLCLARPQLVCLPPVPRRSLDGPRTMWVNAGTSVGVQHNATSVHTCSKFQTMLSRMSQRGPVKGRREARLVQELFQAPAALRSNLCTSSRDIPIAADTHACCTPLQLRALLEVALRAAGTLLHTGTMSRNDIWGVPLPVQYQPRAKSVGGPKLQVSSHISLHYPVVAAIATQEQILVNCIAVQGFSSVGLHDGCVQTAVGRAAGLLACSSSCSARHAAIPAAGAYEWYA